MKLGFSYNLFDGEELLTYAIQAIRNSVDYISVVYQTKSNFGEPIELSFDWLSFVDDAILFEPDLSKSPRVNETRKRNIGREYSESNNCTHHASLDVDEFYTSADIELVREMKEDVAVCHYSNYFKKPTWKIVPAEKFVVSFIHKVRYEYRLEGSFRYNVDPTRRLPGVESYRRFVNDEIEMQHMTFVRRDIERKIRNSSAEGQYAEMLGFYNTYSLGEDIILPPSKTKKTTIEVANQFGIKEPL